jgi:hypothetical protein
MYDFTPFMDLAAAYSGSRPLYGVVYTIGGYSEGFYYPKWVVA